jgi:hypothetical protein
MSLVDDVFKQLPAPLLTKWGQDLTYVKAATTETYDPATGTISGSETNVTVKGIITKLTPKEFRGQFQTTDIKIIIGNAELGNYFPNIRDRIEYDEGGTTRVARIIDVDTYRGEQAILHNIIARPQ